MAGYVPLPRASAESPTSNCWECRVPRCWLKALRGAGEQAMMLAWALASFADKSTGEAYPSQEKLMDTIGIQDKRTFHRALESVKARLAIEIIPKAKKMPSGQRVTLYRLRHCCGAPWAASIAKRPVTKSPQVARSTYPAFAGTDSDGEDLFRRNGVLQYYDGRLAPPEKLQGVA